MEIFVSTTSEELGKKAAEFSAKIISEQIAAKGNARIILSTGASQFNTLEALSEMEIKWDKVEIFHLDEYIGLTEEHPASFRKYIKERVVKKLPGNVKVHYVNGDGDVNQQMEELTLEIRKAPIDLALIGIGENAHIAFNDPPADFDTQEAFIKVELDDACKKQQVGEGWFPTIEDVPNQAITMTVYQIMQSNVIVSCVPYKVKANAVKSVLENDVNNNIPATILKQHKNFNLFLDEDSSSEVDKSLIFNR